MKIKLNLAVASMLALAVSSQVFAQDNAGQTPVPPAPVAATAPPAAQPNVPAPKQATTQSLGDLTPYAIAIGVIVVVAVASGGGGRSSANGTTGTTP